MNAKTDSDSRIVNDSKFDRDAKFDGDNGRGGEPRSRASGVDPVDERLSPGALLLYGLQHLLVMAAAPITAVFLISQALDFSTETATALMSATFLACGVGTLLQTFGPLGIGARLPFVQVPGGAPIVIFLTIAQTTDIQTAVGAVILTALCYFLVLPFFTRLLRFFPPIVIGTMLLLVAVNLIRIFGSLIIGKPGSDGYAAPLQILLALATMGSIVLFARLLSGAWQRISVMLGLVVGVLVAAVAGEMHFTPIMDGPLIALPTLFPFGMPHFDLFASLPLIIFSVIAMTEATGQTLATADIVGKRGDARLLVPRNIRADAVGSLLGGCLGTSLIITSGENIGIVRTTGVRSRYVTAVTGTLLILLALFAPLGRLAATLPNAVVAGTAVIVFAVIGVMGVNLLRRVDFDRQGNLFTLAAGLAMGLLPILVPDFYSAFPASLQIVLGNGLAMGTVTAVLVNLLFHHTGATEPSRER